jgi:hypothetical protein
MLLENLFNRINDWDWIWMGFHRLKPAQNERMPNRTVILLSLVYAPFCAVFEFVVFSLMRAPRPFCWGVSVIAGVGFILLQSLSAFFWNRRASRLQISEGR